MGEGNTPRARLAPPGGCWDPSPPRAMGEGLEGGGGVTCEVSLVFPTPTPV